MERLASALHPLRTFGHQSPSKLALIGTAQGRLSGLSCSCRNKARQPRLLGSCQQPGRHNNMGGRPWSERLLRSRRAMASKANHEQISNLKEVLRLLNLELRE